MKSNVMTISAMCVLILLNGCADDRVSQNQEQAQKTLESSSQAKNNTDAKNPSKTKSEVMIKNDPNAYDRTSSNTNEPKVSTSAPNSSKSLKDLLKEQGEIKQHECEDEFKNENGICEVPNQPHPDKTKQ